MTEEKYIELIRAQQDLIISQCYRAGMDRRETEKELNSCRMLKMMNRQFSEFIAIQPIRITMPIEKFNQSFAARHTDKSWADGL